MVALDVHDDTDEELLALELAMLSEKKKTSRKTKQIIKAYRYRLYPNQEQETLIK